MLCALSPETAVGNKHHSSFSAKEFFQWQNSRYKVSAGSREEFGD